VRGHLVHNYIIFSQPAEILEEAYLFTLGHGFVALQLVAIVFHFMTTLHSASWNLDVSLAPVGWLDWVLRIAHRVATEVGVRVGKKTLRRMSLHARSEVGCQELRKSSKEQQGEGVRRRRTHGREGKYTSTCSCPPSLLNVPHPTNKRRAVPTACVSNAGTLCYFWHSSTYPAPPETAQ